MKRLTTHITAKQYTALKALAQHRGVPLAEVLRQALTAGLAALEQPHGDDRHDASAGTSGLAGRPWHERD